MPRLRRRRCGVFRKLSQEIGALKKALSDCQRQWLSVW